MITPWNKLGKHFSIESVRTARCHRHLFAHILSIGEKNYTDGIVELYDDIVSRQVRALHFRASNDLPFGISAWSRPTIFLFFKISWIWQRNSKWCQHVNSSTERRISRFSWMMFSILAHLLALVLASIPSFVQPLEHFSIWCERIFNRSSQITSKENLPTLTSIHPRSHTVASSQSRAILSLDLIRNYLFTPVMTRRLFLWPWHWR